MTLRTAISATSIGAQLRRSKRVAIQERGGRDRVADKANKGRAFEESWSAWTSARRISDGAGEGFDFVLPKLLESLAKS